MNYATLNYIINIGNEVKTLKLESLPLFSMDRHTAPYLNEADFLSHYYNKDKILRFIRENGNVQGKLSMTYAKSVKEKEEIPILFNAKGEIVLENDPNEGKIAEVEKGRKLLFNSKNQLFTRLVISLRFLNEFLNKLIDLTPKEASYVTKQGIKTIAHNDKSYIRFRDLFQYRLKNKKLGYLRLVYEDMLNVIKEEIMECDDNNFYYFTRQFKFAINKYNSYIGELSVKNLKIKSFKNTNRYMLYKRTLNGYFIL